MPISRNLRIAHFLEFDMSRQEGILYRMANIACCAGAQGTRHSFCSLLSWVHRLIAFLILLPCLSLSYTLYMCSINQDQRKSGSCCHLAIHWCVTAGAAPETQEAAALAFGRLFMMPSVRATSALGHVGAGACSDNSKVSPNQHFNAILQLIAT